MAFLDDEADSCSDCGHPLEESASPEADPDNPDGKYRYQSSNPLVCFSCEERKRAYKALQKNSLFKDRDVMIATRRIER